VPESLAPELKSTFVRPVLDALAEKLRPEGHRDFTWPQELTVREVYRKIEVRAYAPYFGTRVTPEILSRLRSEFHAEWTRGVTFTETIRLYRFVRS
jgi:hypothetical protein